MSVLIKMEMPKSCHECVAGYGCCCYIATAEADGICPDHGRPVWCPFVAVPPHGDLIDRDALKAAICSRLCIKDLTYLSPAEKAIVDEINNAPVVIPAEEGE